MRREPNIPDNLFIEHGKAIEAILRRAVRAALLDHKRAGHPVAAWQEGRVVILSPAEIPDEDSTEQEAA